MADLTLLRPSLEGVEGVMYYSLKQKGIKTQLGSQKLNACRGSLVDIVRIL